MKMKKYHDLTKYVTLLEKEKSYGEWVRQEPRGNDENGNFLPYVEAYVRYSPTVIDLMCDVSHFRASAVKNAFKENAIEYTEYNLKNFDLSHATPELIISFLQKIVKNERFRDGVVLEALQEGYVINWLKLLDSFDN